MNTIVYEDELEDTQRLIWDLYRAGADAILVQDMALLKMQLPPIALHASTQTDNRSPEKVNWLLSHGFERVYLLANYLLMRLNAFTSSSPMPNSKCLYMVHCALVIRACAMCRNIASRVAPIEGLVPNFVV